MLAESEKKDKTLGIIEQVFGLRVVRWYLGIGQKREQRGGMMLMVAQERDD